MFHKTDKGYIAPYAKIRDLHSSISEYYNSDVNYKYKGVYIDVFPMEKCSYVFTRISDSLHAHLLYKISHVRAGLMRRIYLNSMFYLLTFIYSLFRLLDCFCVKKENLTFTYGTACGYYNFVNSDIIPLSDINFEGHMFNAPHAPELILKKQYGNYMELPAEESRETHTLSVELNK